MTLPEFRRWAHQAAAWLRRDITHGHHRAHADQIRAHDPTLASLYDRAQDAQDAIRAHILARVETPT